MKLWDLRMVMSTQAFAEKNPMQHTRGTYYDYRWDRVRRRPVVPSPGRQLRRHLPRSPRPTHFDSLPLLTARSTDSRYVYSGSYDGRIYVWNMDATRAATINVRSATARAAARQPLQPILRHPALGHRRARGQLASQRPAPSWYVLTYFSFRCPVSACFPLTLPVLL